MFAMSTGNLNLTVSLSVRPCDTTFGQLDKKCPKMHFFQKETCFSVRMSVRESQFHSVIRERNNLSEN